MILSIPQNIVMNPNDVMSGQDQSYRYVQPPPSGGGVTTPRFGLLLLLSTFLLHILRYMFVPNSL